MSKLVFLEKKRHLFNTVVTVQMPGIKEPQQFTSTFLDVPRSALRKEMEDDNADQQVSRVVLKGWDGIIDEDGQNVPYTRRRTVHPAASTRTQARPQTGAAAP